MASACIQEYVCTVFCITNNFLCHTLEVLRRSLGMSKLHFCFLVFSFRAWSGRESCSLLTMEPSIAFSYPTSAISLLVSVQHKTSLCSVSPIVSGEGNYLKNELCIYYVFFELDDRFSFSNSSNKGCSVVNCQSYNPC